MTRTFQVIINVIITVISLVLICSSSATTVRALDIPFSQLEHQVKTAYDNGNYTGVLFYTKKALQLH